MQEHTFWETIKIQGTELLGKVKQFIHEGNVRRVIIKQGDRTIAEFPLTAGVVGTVFAPVLAAVGALAALLNECSIDVERVGSGPAGEDQKRSEQDK
jgi:D-aminopeptidase